MQRAAGTGSPPRTDPGRGRRRVRPARRPGGSEPPPRAVSGWASRPPRMPIGCLRTNLLASPALAPQGHLTSPGGAARPGVVQFAGRGRIRRSVGRSPCCSSRRHGAILVSRGTRAAKAARNVPSARSSARHRDAAQPPPPRETQNQVRHCAATPEPPATAIPPAIGLEEHGSLAWVAPESMYHFATVALHRRPPACQRQRSPAG